MTVTSQDLVQAGLESIRYRQSLSPLGGIVESDPRVDRGNYLYEDRCWLRNYHVEPLLALGEAEIVFKNLDYWLKALELEGDFFRHNYHHQTAKSRSEQVQIDNNAHFIHHVYYTLQSQGPGEWLESYAPAVSQCAHYLCSRFDERQSMLSGQEERVIEGISYPVGFSFYINRVCITALERAHEIAQAAKATEANPKWLEIAQASAQGVRDNLWDDARQCYAYFQFDPQAEHDKAGKLSPDQSWGLLWAYIHNTEYTELDKLSVHQRLNSLWGVDPQLPEFICQKEPSHILGLLETGDDKDEFKYSGVGVCPAANAVAAWIVGELEGDQQLAEKLWTPLTQYDWDRGQVPEHINTMHPGRMKDYTLWPDPKSHVDSGNLMHLTMVMTVAIRLKKV